MAERDPGRLNTIAERRDQGRSLTVTLSEIAQPRILSGVKAILKQYTNTEILQWRRKRLSHYNLTEIEEVRLFAREIINNLGIRMNPKEALDLGMTEFIPPEQLQKWTTEPTVNDTTRLYAQYFSEKETRKKT